MKRRKNAIRRAYEPYYREAFYCLVIDISVLIICALVLCANDGFIVMSKIYWLFLICFLLFCFIHYNIAILSVIEVAMGMFKTEKLYMIDIRDDWADSAPKYSVSKSIIPKLYPESMWVDRCKIICRKKDGRKVVLRCAVSFKKLLILSEKISPEKPLLRSVTFGKLSHVIVFYEDKDDLADMLNLKL